MGDERLDGGFTLKEAIEVCKLLQAAGVDAIDIVSGVAESREWIIPSVYFPRGCNVSLSEAVKKVVTVPVSVAGRINDPYFANEILEKSQADFVSLGRALIADPEFPAKLLSGSIDKAPAVEQVFPPADTLPRGALLNWFCTQLALVGKTGRPDLSISLEDGHERYLDQIKTATERLIAVRSQ